MEEKRIVLWDIGGVLNQFNFAEWLLLLTELMGTTRYRMMEFLCLGGTLLHEDSFLKRIEAGYNGESGPVGIYNEFIKYFHPKKYVSFDDFKRVFGGSLSPSPAFSELKKISVALSINGIEQGILSNINTLHTGFVERFLDEYGMGEFIPQTHRFYSCEIGISKSEDSKAFLDACGKVGVKPEDACLIDNKVQNVRGALLCGGKGILYLDPESTLEKLIEFGFLPR